MPLRRNEEWNPTPFILYRCTFVFRWREVTTGKIQVRRK